MQQGIGNAKEVISENIVHGSNDLKGKSNRKLQKARLTNDRTQERSEITPGWTENANVCSQGLFLLYNIFRHFYPKTNQNPYYYLQNILFCR